MKLFLLLFPFLAFPYSVSLQYVQIEIAEPFTVRTVQGRILDQAKSPISGAKFELQMTLDTS